MEELLVVRRSNNNNDDDDDHDDGHHHVGQDEGIVLVNENDDDDDDDDGDDDAPLPHLQITQLENYSNNNNASNKTNTDFFPCTTLIVYSERSIVDYGGDADDNDRTEQLEIVQIPGTLVYIPNLYPEFFHDDSNDDDGNDGDRDGGGVDDAPPPLPPPPLPPLAIPPQPLLPQLQLVPRQQQQQQQQLPHQDDDNDLENDADTDTDDDEIDDEDEEENGNDDNDMFDVDDDEDDDNDDDDNEWPGDNEWLGLLQVAPRVLPTRQPPPDVLELEYTYPNDFFGRSWKDVIVRDAVRGWYHYYRLLIDPSCTEIPDWMFHQCDALVELVFPHGSKIIRIGKHAFAYCKNLRRINKLPVGLEKLDYHAFNHCERIEGMLIIPYSVAQVCFSCFGYCASITSVVFEPAPPTTTPADVDLQQRVFEYCIGITTVQLPKFLRAIQFCCFEGCTALVDIPIPGTVLDVSIRSFNGCSSLQSIDLPESVTAIHEKAYMNCTALESVTIRHASSSLERFLRLDTNIFQGCTALSIIRIHPWLFPKLLQSMYNDPNFLFQFMRDYHSQMDQYVQWKRSETILVQQKLLVRINNDKIKAELVQKELVARINNDKIKAKLVALAVIGLEVTTGYYYCFFILAWGLMYFCNLARLRKIRVRIENDGSVTTSITGLWNTALYYFLLDLLLASIFCSLVRLVNFCASIDNNGRVTIALVDYIDYTDYFNVTFTYILLCLLIVWNIVPINNFLLLASIFCSLVRLVKFCASIDNDGRVTIALVDYIDSIDYFNVALNYTLLCLLIVRDIVPINNRRDFLSWTKTIFVSLFVGIIMNGTTTTGFNVFSVLTWGLVYSIECKLARLEKLRVGIENDDGVHNNWHHRRLRVISYFWICIKIIVVSYFVVGNMKLTGYIGLFVYWGVTYNVDLENLHNAVQHDGRIDNEGINNNRRRQRVLWYLMSCIKTIVVSVFVVSFITTTTSNETISTILSLSTQLVLFLFTCM